MSLITTAEAKTYLGITDDTLVSSLISAAEKRMEKEAGRRLATASRTERISGTGSRSIWIAEPAESITTIHVDSDRAFGDDTLISASDYYLDGCRIAYLDHVWVVGQLNIQVVYLAGYATAPDDLADACKIQVAAMYSQWKRAKGGKDILASESVAEWARTYLARQGLEPEVAAVVMRYRPERL